MPRKTLESQIEVMNGILPASGEMLYSDLREQLRANDAGDVANLGYALTRYGVKFRTHVSSDGQVSLFVSKGA